jgi:hypothetical protein
MWPQVEATKFTEVGFHGRDVDQIIRDLVDNAIIMMRQVGGDLSGGDIAGQEGAVLIAGVQCLAKYLTMCQCLPPPVLCCSGCAVR